MSDREDDVIRRFRQALEMFETGVAIMRQNLRRKFPDLDEAELNARMRAWLRDRPGAVHGDGVGVPRPVPE